MINKITILLSFFYAIQAAYYNPWEGNSMKSFIRGSATASLSIPISQSEFYYAAF